MNQSDVEMTATASLSNSIVASLRRQGIILGGIVLLLWALELFDILFLDGALDAYGVRPRTLVGLRGIFLAPFLHAGLRHLIANTIPFLILGWFVMMRGVRAFTSVSIVVVVVSGLGIWLTGGPSSVHLGASGVVFGYFGYLLLRGYFERSFSSIMWSILVVFLYGGMLWGVLPQGMGISWQAHLFGFVGGGVAAFLFARRRGRAEGPAGS